MDHAVAIEGVIRLFAEDMNRIGAHPQKVPLQIFGDGADHFHALGVALLGNWTEVAVEEKIGGGCIRLYECHERFLIQIASRYL